MSDKEKIKLLQVPALAPIAGGVNDEDPIMNFRMWLREVVSDCITPLELHLQTVVIDPANDSPEYIQAISAAQNFITVIKTEMKEIATIQNKAMFAEAYKDFLQVINTYRGSVEQATQINFEIVGFSPEIYNVNEVLNIAEYHGKFVKELDTIYQSAISLTHQYDARLHRHFFILADLVRFIATQLIRARTSNSYKQLRRIRHEIDGELAGFQYQLREIESPRMPDEDQTGKIPPAVLGVDFARGWVMRELQYVRGSLIMTLQTLKDRLTGEQTQALFDAHQWMDRVENRIMGVTTHAGLQEQFDLMNFRQAELSENIFPELHQKPA